MRAYNQEVDTLKKEVYKRSKGGKKYGDKEREKGREKGNSKMEGKIVRRPSQRLRALVEIGRSYVKEKDRVIRKDPRELE